MKAEYARIVEDVQSKYMASAASQYGRACHEVAARCEALANKPVRELTDEEIGEVWDEVSNNGKHRFLVEFGYLQFARALLAKQYEPDEIPFDQNKLDEGGWEVKFQYIGGETAGSDRINKVTLVRKQ